MKKLTFILATALMMTACATTVEKQAEVPAIDINNFDEAIDLKADFYQWATGGWQKNNPLKPEFSRYGSFDVLRENNEVRINELFSEMTESKAEVVPRNFHTWRQPLHLSTPQPAIPSSAYM